MISETEYLTPAKTITYISSKVLDFGGESTEEKLPQSLFVTGVQSCPDPGTARNRVGRKRLYNSSKIANSSRYPRAVLFIKRQWLVHPVYPWFSATSKLCTLQNHVS